MANSVSKNILQWQVDQARLNKFIADNNKAGAAAVEQAKRAAAATNSARDATAAYNNVLGALGATANANLTILDQKFRDAEASTKRLKEAEAAVTTELARQIPLLERASVLANARAAETRRFIDAETAGLNLGGAGGGRTAGQSITKAGRDLFNLPDVGGSTVLSRLLIVGGAAVDKFNISTGSLVAGLSLGIPIAAAAAVGIQAVTRALQENIDRQKRYAEALFQVAEAVQSSSRKQIEAQIQALEAQNAVQRAGVALVEEQTGRTAASLEGLARTDLSDFFSFVGLVQNFEATLSGLSGSAEVVAEANKQIDTNTFLMDALRAVLDDSTVAATSAAEAERELADARNQYINQITADFEREADLRTQLAALRRTGTSEQIQERLQANRDEAAIISSFLIPSINSLGLTSEAAQKKLAEYQGRLRELTHQDELLLQAVLPVIEARERETAAAEALSAQTDAYFEALEIEGKAREAYTAAVQKEADAAAESAAKIDGIRADLAEKEAELWRKAGDDILEAQNKAQESRLKQEQAYYKQVQDIQRRANATIANAIYARDALAAYLAQQQKAEDLRKAKEDNDERLKQIDDALEDQKAVIAKRLDEQLKAQRKAADDAIRTELDRRRKEADINRRAIQESLVAYQNAAYATQQIALYGSNGRRVIETQLWQDINAVAVTWAANTVNTLRSILSVGGSSASGGSSRFPPLVGGDGYLLPGQIGIGTYAPSPTSGLSRSTTTINIGVNAKEFRNVSKQEAINILGRVLEA